MAGLKLPNATIEAPWASGRISLSATAKSPGTVGEFCAALAKRFSQHGRVLFSSIRHAGIHLLLDAAGTIGARQIRPDRINNSFGDILHKEEQENQKAPSVGVFPGLPHGCSRRSRRDVKIQMPLEVCIPFLIFGNLARHQNPVKRGRMATGSFRNSNRPRRIRNCCQREARCCETPSGRASAWCSNDDKRNVSRPRTSSSKLLDEIRIDFSQPWSYVVPPS